MRFFYVSLLACLFSAGFALAQDKRAPAEAKAAPANATAYPGGGVRELAISRDGRTLAIACPEGLLYVFDLPTATLRHQLQGHSTGVWCVANSADGQTLASGSGEYNQGQIPGEVILWDLATGSQRMKLKGHQGPAFGLEF